MRIQWPCTLKIFKVNAIVKSRRKKKHLLGIISIIKKKLESLISNDEESMHDPIKKENLPFTFGRNIKGK